MRAIAGDLKAMRESAPIRRRLRLCELRDEGMARQKGEDLARDEGTKARDAPFFDARPFRMRARQDDRHLLIEAEAHELRLLASHHIGKGLDALIGETGDEADDAAIGELQPFDRRASASAPAGAST